MSTQRLVEVANDLTSDEARIPDYKKFSSYQHRVPGHRDGSRTHISTFIRWATKGVKTASGEVVRLHTADDQPLVAEQLFHFGRKAVHILVGRSALAVNLVLRGA